MQEIQILLVIILVFLLLRYIWKLIDPKLDYNIETHEPILWYNDITDSLKRKFLTL